MSQDNPQFRCTDCKIALNGFQEAIEHVLAAEGKRITARQIERGILNNFPVHPKHTITHWRPTLIDRAVLEEKAEAEAPKRPHNWNKPRTIAYLIRCHDCDMEFTSTQQAIDHVFKYDGLKRAGNHIRQAIYGGDAVGRHHFYAVKLGEEPSPPKFNPSRNRPIRNLSTKTVYLTLMDAVRDLPKDRSLNAMHAALRTAIELGKVFYGARWEYVTQAPCDAPAKPVGTSSDDGAWPTPRAIYSRRVREHGGEIFPSARQVWESVGRKLSYGTVAHNIANGIPVVGRLFTFIDSPPKNVLRRGTGIARAVQNQTTGDSFSSQWAAFISTLNIRVRYKDFCLAIRRDGNYGGQRWALERKNERGKMDGSAPGEDRSAETRVSGRDFANADGGSAGARPAHPEEQSAAAA